MEKSQRGIGKGTPSIGSYHGGGNCLNNDLIHCGAGTSNGGDGWRGGRG